MPRLAVEMRTFQGLVEVGFPVHKMEKRVRRNVEIHMVRNYVTVTQCILMAFDLVPSGASLLYTVRQPVYGEHIAGKLRANVPKARL